MPLSQAKSNACHAVESDRIARLAPAPLSRNGSQVNLARISRKNGKTIKKAIDWEGKGKLDEAALLFENALAAEPDHFEALFRLGALRFGQGRFEDALRHFDQATKVRPYDAMAWSNVAVVYLNLARPLESLACSEKALALKPDYPEVLNSRGNAFMCLARPAEAAESFEKALALRPDYLEALVNYGSALKDLRQFERALATYERALELRTDIAAIHCNRAAVLIELNRAGEALISSDRALALAPDNFVAINNRAGALRLLKRPEEALTAYDAALAINRTNADLWRNRGGVLAGLNRPHDALASLEEALTVAPDYVAGHESKAIILGELGRFKDAGASIRRAIKLSPNCACLYYNLTQLERLSHDDPEVAEMDRLGQNIEVLDVRDQIFLHYALAKVHEDNGEEEASFHRQCAGAALKRRLVNFDEARVFGAMDRTKQVFDVRLFQEMAGLGDASQPLIFIVGMPRSGSTLVEQILASHAGVAGLGEIDAFSKAMSDFNGSGGSPFLFPDSVAALSQAQLRRIGESYVRRIEGYSPGAKLVVDKMLDNFRFVGLIHLALPNARFIHVRRDPIANCLSCFSKWFSDGIDYSYDLGELGRYYRAYEKLMAHWRSVLPQGVILDVQYEDVVADLEGQTRRLAVFCGLEWDARCQEFHRTERQVRTASNLQVRQPLFDGSIRRGRGLDAYIAPLKAELGLPIERPDL
jgi:tetratricopeptide (TPR) repeat protein